MMQFSFFFFPALDLIREKLFGTQKIQFGIYQEDKSEMATRVRVGIW